MNDKGKKCCSLVLKLACAWCVLAGFVTGLGPPKGIEHVVDGQRVQSPMNILGRKYRNLENQTWLLEEDNGNWALVFHYMDIETSDQCEFDYLMILEKDSVMPVSRYCGQVTPQPYISETSRLMIRFISDSMWSGTGFALTAFHARNRVLVMNKANQTRPAGSEDTSTKALEASQDLSGVVKEPAFRVLLGLVVTVFALFAVLLTYLLCSIRKQNNQKKMRNTDSSYYLSSSSTSDTSDTPTDTTSVSFARLLSAKPRDHYPHTLRSTSGKRYSKKDKAQPTVTKPGHMDGGGEEQPSHVTTLDELMGTQIVALPSHHNTVYFLDN